MSLAQVTNSIVQDPVVRVVLLGDAHDQHTSYMSTEPLLEIRRICRNSDCQDVSMLDEVKPGAALGDR